jgi:hypothetical protein
MRLTLFPPAVTRLIVLEILRKKLKSYIGAGYKKNIPIIYECQTTEPNRIVTA